VRVATVEKRVTRVGMLIILRSLEEVEVKETEPKFLEMLSDRNLEIWRGVWFRKPANSKVQIRCQNVGERIRGGNEKQGQKSFWPEKRVIFSLVLPCWIAFQSARLQDRQKVTSREQGRSKMRYELKGFASKKGIISQGSSSKRRFHLAPRLRTCGSYGQE